MIGGAKQVLLAIAALCLSAGHAACACLGAAQDAAPSFHSSKSDAGHAHHHGEEVGRDAPGDPAPSPGECGHCEIVALAGDGALAAGSLPKVHETFAFAASPAFASTPQDMFGDLARRLHWAAPPRRTPVSLKIRLRN